MVMKYHVTVRRRSRATCTGINLPSARRIGTTHNLNRWLLFPHFFFALSALNFHLNCSSCLAGRQAHFEPRPNDLFLFIPNTIFKSNKIVFQPSPDENTHKK